MADTTQMSSTAASKGLLVFYWRSLIRPNFKPAVLISVLMLAGSLFQMGTIGLAVPLLEAVSNGGGNAPSRVLDVFRAFLRTVGFTPTNQTVVLAVLAFASVLFVLYSAFLLLHQYLSAAIAEKLRRETKFNLFRHFLSGAYLDVSRRGRGAILQDLTGPPGAVYTAVIRLSTLFTAIFNTAALLIFMMYMSWWATIAIGVVALGGIYGTRRILDRHAESAGRELYALQTDESKVVVDAIDGLKVVKCHAVEDRIGKRLKGLLQGEVRPSLRMAFFRYLPSFLNEFAASVIVILFGAIALFRPSLGLSFPILVGFLMAIRQCGGAIANINANIVELQTLRRGVEILNEVLETAPSEKSGVRTIDRVSEVRLKNVSVQYDSDSLILSGINLTLTRGTITAIVGPTGAGKSTIAQLIAGLILPSAGALTVGGIDIRDLNLAEWRKKIGYVFQDVFLFNSSIRDNIALWMEGVSQADIEAAARLAQLHDFVASLPEGYDTVVGDRGLRLSGGECQRIAIARAVLVRPAILILDEATSALDNLTEKAVYQAMNALRGEAIVLAIAHRLSTVKDADQIVVLESGRIVQTGTHASLIVEGGSYSKLFELESVRSRHH